MVFNSRAHSVGISSKRLLSDTDDDEMELTDRTFHAKAAVGQSNRKRKCSAWVLLHIVFIVCYSAVFLAVIAYSVDSKKESLSLLPLPAREALKPEIRPFKTALESNSFVGTPREELEEAWHDLLQNDNIRLPRESLDRLGLRSIYTKDGREGIASLSVFHSLHCLKLVRQMAYKEFYHPNMAGTAMQRQMKHTDHCIEYLRETLTCKPDISLVTFRWINNTAQHPEDPGGFYPTNFDSAQHECMDWKLLNSWAEKRSYNLYNLQALDRPE